MKWVNIVKVNIYFVLWRRVHSALRGLSVHSCPNLVQVTAQNTIFGRTEIVSLSPSQYTHTRTHTITLTRPNLHTLLNQLCSKFHYLSYTLGQSLSLSLSLFFQWVDVFLSCLFNSKCCSHSSNKWLVCFSPSFTQSLFLVPFSILPKFKMYSNRSKLGFVNHQPCFSL